MKSNIGSASTWVLELEINPSVGRGVTILGDEQHPTG